MVTCKPDQNECLCSEVYVCVAVVFTKKVLVYDSYAGIFESLDGGTSNSKIFGSLKSHVKKFTVTLNLIHTEKRYGSKRARMVIEMYIHKLSTDCNTFGFILF